METADRHSLRRGIIVALLFLLLLQSTSAMRDLKGPGGFNIILGTMKEMANNPPGPNEWKIWQIEDVDSAGNRKSTGFFYFDFGRNQAAAVRGDFEKGVGGMTAFWSPPPVLRNNTAANAISNWASQSYGRGPGSQVWGIGLTNPDFIPEGHPPSYEAGATRSMVIAHEKGHYDLLAHPQLQQYVQQFWNDLGPDGQAELRSAMGKRLNEMADPRVAQQIMSDSPTGSSGIATEIFLRTLESPEAGYDKPVRLAPPNVPPLPLSEGLKKKLKESFERAYRGYKAAKESMGASSDAATGFSGENKPGQLPGGEPISGNFPPVEDPKYPKEQKPPAPPFYDPELSVEKCEVDSSCNNILECLGKLGKLIACQLGGKSKIVEPPKSSAVKDVAAKDFSSGLDSKLTDSGNAVIALVSKEGENVDASSFEADAKKHSEPPLPAIPVEYQRVTIPKGSDFVPPRLKENGVNTPTSPGVYVYQKKSKEEGGGIELMDMQSLQDYAKHVDSAGKPVGDCPGCHYMGSGGYKKLKKK